MKNSFAIALLLGASVEAVELDRKYRRHVDTPSLALKKKEYAILNKDLASIRSDYNNLREEEAAVHSLVKPVSVAQNRFADGYKDEEELGDNLNMIEWNARHNDGWLRNYKFLGNQARPFADGYVEGEKMGETISLKDADVNGPGTQSGLFDVHLTQKKPVSHAQKRFASGYADEEELGDNLNMIEWNAKHNDGWLRNYKFLGNEARPFADGYVEGEKMGETISLKDADVNGPGTQSGLFDVHFTQKKPTSHAQKQFASGYADEEELGDNLNMIEWNAKHNDGWLRNYKFAQEKRPQSTSYAQLEEPVAPGSGFPNTLAPVPGPMLGKPGLPSQSLLTAEPEKEWQEWAQDFVDWEDNQTDMANTRLPYASTLLQTSDDLSKANSEASWASWEKRIEHSKELAKLESHDGGSPSEGNLLQLSEPLAPGLGYPNTLALPGPNAGYPGLPSQSLLTAEPEKEWQEWAQDFVDWEDNQTDMANTRLPYASTLLQTGYDDMARASSEQEWASWGKRIETNKEMAKLVHVGTDEEGELVMLQAPDDDPSKLEDFIMEDSGIPLNMRL